MRLWLIAGSVVSAIALTLYIALSACAASSDDGGADRAVRGRDQNWTPPQQIFFGSPMRDIPAVGWRTTAEQLGLPTSTSPGGLTRIATSPDPYRSAPFIGNLGDKAYFVTKSESDQPVWRLSGIDIHTGVRLFAPATVGSGESTSCYLNGPDAVLCISRIADGYTASVVDASTGEIIYAGDTDLTTSTGQLGVEQQGIYAVATVISQGVYGIGDRGETTWFVPGDGRPSQGTIGANDLGPLSLAAQTVAGRGASRMRVFSLVDGKIIEPELDAGVEVGSAVVYPGGFALEIRSRESLSYDALAFFDDKGIEIGRSTLEGSLDTLGRNLPVVISAAGATVYSAGGHVLARISGFEPGYGALMIGSRLFVHQPRPGVWRQYDLRTGEEGQQCNQVMTDYIGSDGTVGIFAKSGPEVGLETRAIDLATCERLWTISSPPGSFRYVWRINTTLVQLSDDGTELMSLVAPS